MSLLSAMFLWALPLAAIPVAIHLLHRRQQKVIRWGAMQFLLDSTRRRRRIWRLDDLLLMVLRCAALLALILALARPLVRASWMGSGPQRDVILVLDVSLSMGRTAEGASPFDRLQEQLESTFRQLSDHDSLQVVLAAATPLWLTSEPVLKNSKDWPVLQARLRRLEPSLGPADLMTAMEQALTTESDVAAPARIVSVITDVRAQGMPAEGVIAAARLSQLISAAPVPTVVNVIDVGSSTPEIRNVGLESLESDRVLAGIGERVELKARVRNYGTMPVESCPLRWSVDGDSVSVSFTEPLDPGQTAVVTIEHQFDEPGVFAAECRIDAPDELPADNSAKLILEARTKIPILVVSTAAGNAVDEEAKYVLAALKETPSTGTSPAVASFFEPKLVDLAELEKINLSDYLGVVWIDVGTMTESAAQKLHDFVSAGGGLWLALGGHTDAEAFHRTFVEGAGGLSPVALEGAIGEEKLDAEFATLHPPASGHSATTLLGDTVRLDILEARLFRRWQWKPVRADDKLSVLLETGRGEPVAVERFLGRGRVIVQAFPLTRSWSNVTLCKLFVPYVQEWLRYLVQPATAARNLTINAPLIWRRPADTQEAKAVLQGPLQEPIALVPNVEREELAYRYFGTVFPGDYTIQVEGETAPALFHVQREPMESDLRPWPLDQRNALSGVRGIQFGTEPLNWPANMTATAPQTPAWGWCLVGLVALIGLELASICWFAWKKQLINRLPPAAAGAQS